MLQTWKKEGEASSSGNVRMNQNEAQPRAERLAGRCLQSFKQIGRETIILQGKIDKIYPFIDIFLLKYKSDCVSPV